jgi:hypothetical protein
MLISGFTTTIAPNTYFIIIRSAAEAVATETRSHGAITVKASVFPCLRGCVGSKGALAIAKL